MSDETFIGLVIEDKYRLDQKIGEGGMGAVYLGTQLMVDRHVAIKLLHSGLSEHERIKQRFEVEAKAIGRMHHPNCITLFDFGFSGELNAFYMVMEYLDGTPMHKRVFEGVSSSEALAITRQIALALDHAHHQGILHRDLKPENVMLTKMTDGSELVKVLDFGIARIFSEDDSEQKSAAEQNRLTRAGEVFGTPAYISPEQARGERELTPASDLYSLGVMLFEMLTGDLPFWGETAMDTIMKHVAEPVPTINRLDIAKDLKQVTYDLLSKDPKRRPQSGKELAERLDAVLQRQHAANADSSMNFIATSAASTDTLNAHATLTDLAPDYNEWAEAGATVVQHVSEFAQGAASAAPAAPMAGRPAAPIADPNFGAQRLAQRPPIHSSPLHQATTAGARTHSTTTKPLSLDELEDPYADLPIKSSNKLLPFVALTLVALIAGGVWIFLNSKKADAIEDTTTQASTFDPSSRTNTIPAAEEPSSTDDAATTPPKSVEHKAPATQDMATGQQADASRGTLKQDDAETLDEPLDKPTSKTSKKKPIRRKTTPAKSTKTPRTPRLDTNVKPFETETKANGTTPLSLD